MTEQRTPTAARAEGPPLDFQTHLAALEARGLLLRIDRPINKDTELHRSRKAAATVRLLPIAMQSCRCIV